ncbi:MAG: hypothetical protein LBI53_06425 [Candidatus Peribacteria bacterium]|nr:hypothetical protein [Candidatus Peribacteria bacterium]
MSDDDRLQYNNNSLCLLQAVYGERVSDTPPEVESVLFKMYSFFSRTKQYIDDKEQQVFQDFLNDSSIKF